MAKGLGATDGERKATRGRPFVGVPASSWNGLMDALRTHKRGRWDEGPPGPLTSEIRPSDTIMVKNTVADFAGPFRVLRIGDPLQTADADGLNLQARFAFNGLTPTTGCKFAILRGPCGLDAIEAAVVSGIATCYVKINDAGHEWADPVTDETRFLESVLCGGQARILWHGAGGDPPPDCELAVVNLIGAVACSGEAGFFARLTTSSSGKWKWVALTLDGSGAWTDDGSEVASYNAVPSTYDGSSFMYTPVAGLRVWMIPSKQAGLYEFMPVGPPDAVITFDSGSGYDSYSVSSTTSWTNILVTSSVADPLVIPGHGTYQVTSTAKHRYTMPDPSYQGAADIGAFQLRWRNNTDGVNYAGTFASSSQLTTDVLDPGGGPNDTVWEFCVTQVDVIAVSSGSDAPKDLYLQADYAASGSGTGVIDELRVSFIKLA